MIGGILSTLQNSRGGFCPPFHKLQGVLCPPCKKHEGCFVHLCQNEQGVFCPGGVLSYIHIIVFGVILGNSFYILIIYIDKVCCVYSLESPQRGKSNENTQDTFMLEKLRDILIMPPGLGL